MKKKYQINETKSEILISNLKFYLENDTFFCYDVNLSYIQKTYRIKNTSNSEIKFFIKKDTLEKCISTSDDISSFYCVTFVTEENKNLLKIESKNNNESNIWITQKDRFFSTEGTRTTSPNFLNFNFNEENIFVSICTNITMEIDGIFTFEYNCENFSKLCNYELENWRKSKNLRNSKNQFLLLQCKNNIDFWSSVKQINFNLYDLKENIANFQNNVIVILTFVFDQGELILDSNKINELMKIENEFGCKLILIKTKTEFLGKNIDEISDSIEMNKIFKNITQAELKNQIST